MNSSDITNGIVQQMASRVMTALCVFAFAIGLILMLRWKLTDTQPIVGPFLEVVLDSEHPGALLCNKPNGKFVPCTIEVRGDGWAVHFQEKP